MNRCGVRIKKKRTKNNEVTGIILAGGRSRRMGRDKALLKVNGIAMFERILGMMQGFFSNVIIAGDRPDLMRPGVPCYSDRYPGSSLEKRNLAVGYINL